MQKWLPYVTALVTLVAFVFSVYQYVDTQRIAERNRRFDQFRSVFVWAAGRTESGVTLVDVQQAIGVYQLSEFPEYRELSLPIIEYFLEQTRREPRDSLFRKSLLHTQMKLRNAPRN